MLSSVAASLAIFDSARNWKGYFGSFIKPLLGSRVAEIGSGFGGTTKALCDGTQDEWLCVEPDPELVREIDRKRQAGEIPAVCKSYAGYSGELTGPFDSVLYIDVIEHIEDDAAELRIAAALLRPGGRLFIIVPAHQSLYTPFDKFIGHYRRYTRDSLKAVVPAGFDIVQLRYLDSMGYVASLVNKVFLRQSMPTLKQVTFWDRVMVPLSKITDRLLGFNFGKSVLLIAQKK